MSAPEVNIPLLRKAVEWAEAEAAKPFELCEWAQGVWVLTPEERADGTPWVEEEALYNKAASCGTCYCIAGYVSALSGNPARGYETEVVARGLLNLKASQAADLFDCDNTIEDVRRIAEDIAGERL